MTSAEFLTSELLNSIPGTGPDGAGSDGQCWYPYLYKGVSYDKCITEGEHAKGAEWCSMTSDFDRDGLWGKCSADDDNGNPKHGPNTTKGKKCHFSFLYKNQTFDACTHVDHAWPW